MDKDKILKEIEKLSKEDKQDILKSLRKKSIGERLEKLREGVDLDLTMEEITAEVKKVRKAMH